MSDTSKPSIVDIDYSKAPVAITEEEQNFLNGIRKAGSFPADYIETFNMALAGQWYAKDKIIGYAGRLYINNEKKGNEDIAKAIYIGLAAIGNTRAMANLGRIRSLNHHDDDAREMLGYVIDDFEFGESGNTNENTAAFAYFSMGELEYLASEGKENHDIAWDYLIKAEGLAKTPNLQHNINLYKSGIQKVAPKLEVRTPESAFGEIDCYARAIDEMSRW